MKAIFAVLLLVVLALPCNAQWQYVGFGFLDGSSPGGNIFALATHDSSLFWSCPGQIYRYTIANGYGRCLDSGLAQGNALTFASLGNYLFAGLQAYNSYRTSDDGHSWQVDAGSPITSNGTYLFCCGTGTMYRSEDGGNNWSAIAGPVVSNFATYGAVIFGTNKNGTYRSNDSGTHWAEDTVPSGLSISAFAVLGTQLFAGGNGVFRSTDLGAHWAQIGLSTRTIYALQSYGTYLFAGNDTGILISSDSGMSWRDVSQGMGKQPEYYYKEVKLLTVLDTFLFTEVYSGTDGSGNTYGYVARRPISEMIDTATSSVQETPQSGDTIVVYPNPAMGTVTIISGGTSIVGVSVRNVLGEDVLDMPNLRESDITLDLSKLPSGTYFVQIQTSDGSVLRKVVIQH